MRQREEQQQPRERLILLIVAENDYNMLYFGILHLMNWVSVDLLTGGDLVQGEKTTQGINGNKKRGPGTGREIRE